MKEGKNPGAIGPLNDDNSIEMNRACVLVLSLDSPRGVQTKSVVDHLEKQGESVAHYPIFDIQPSQLTALRDTISKRLFSNCIITAHGIPQDHNHVYYEEHGATNPYPRGKTADEVSDLLLSILPERDDVTLQLLVCYAARTSNDEAHHIDERDRLDWTDSLAYRIFFRLATENRIGELVAFVTALAYENGKYLAHDERVRTLQQQCEQLYAMKDQLLTESRESYERGNREAGERLQIEEYNFLMEQIGPLLSKISKLSRCENYGKVCFSYNQTSKTCIIAMNHQQEAPYVLYSGPLQKPPTAGTRESEVLARETANNNNNNFSI